MQWPIICRLLIFYDENLIGNKSFNILQVNKLMMIKDDDDVAELLAAICIKERKRNVDGE